MKKTLKVSNITCANCALTIQNYFEKELSIDTSVHVTSKRVTFQVDEAKDDAFFIDHLKTIGYHVILTSEDAQKQRRIDMFDFIVGTLFTLPLLLTMIVHLGMNLQIPMFLMNGYVQWALATPVYLFVGRRFFIATFHQIKAKRLGMDSLVVIGTTAAYVLSIVETIGNANSMHLYFETTAVIIWMVLIGHSFENRVREKTSDELYSLMALEAKEARVKTKDGDIMMPIDAIMPGMIVRVFGNETIPVDGVISDGDSYIDEQMLTGESTPVVKKIGDQVFSATLNMMETLEIKVTKTGNETMLQSIIDTVMETATLKPPVQRVADKIASIFVPVVILISLLTFFIWLFIIQEGIESAFSASIAVLVISCPCALGLATPTSISVGSGIAFKRGILYKGGAFFEEAPKINSIAFDKTGTLTSGSPEVKAVEGNVLWIAAALENHTKHPLANAIISHYQGDIKVAKDVKQLVGKGISGFIEKKLYYIGSNAYMDDLGLKHVYDVNYFLESGNTVIFVADAQQVLGYIVIHDPLKHGIKDLINDLKNHHLEPIMITGDQEKTTYAIAKDLGISEVYANVMPQDKASIIQQLQAKGLHVAFVGDGMNDAPALKISNIGFAVKSGHDVALDASDVTLMQPNMSLVMDALDLSKATLKNIKLNFLWAFLYNIILIPVAALGLLNPSLAGIGMAFSSIMVVLNALSLHRFKFRKDLS